MFTLNVMCAAPVTYCKDVLAKKDAVKAVSSAGDQQIAGGGAELAQRCAALVPLACAHSGRKGSSGRCVSGCRRLTPAPLPMPLLQVLTNAGQANAATGAQGYADAVECASALAGVLGVTNDDVLIMSTGEGGG